MSPASPSALPFRPTAARTSSCSLGRLAAARRREQEHNTVTRPLPRGGRSAARPLRLRRPATTIGVGSHHRAEDPRKSRATIVEPFKGEVVEEDGTGHPRDLLAGPGAVRTYAILPAQRSRPPPRTPASSMRGQSLGATCDAASRRRPGFSPWTALRLWPLSHGSRPSLQAAVVVPRPCRGPAPHRLHG